MRISLRTSINRKCKDCAYDSFDHGNWREQVTMCTCTDCPLWEVRPKCANQSQKQAERLLCWMKESGAAHSHIDACLGPVMGQVRL